MRQGRGSVSRASPRDTCEHRATWPFHLAGNAQVMVQFTGIDRQPCFLLGVLGL